MYIPELAPLILSSDSSAPCGRPEKVCSSNPMTVSASYREKVWLVLLGVKMRGGGGRRGWSGRMVGETLSTGDFTRIINSETV